MSKQVIEKLKAKFGAQILETHDQHGDDTAVVEAAAWKSICEFLRKESSLDFDMFVDMYARVLGGDRADLDAIRRAVMDYAVAPQEPGGRAP